jgi:protein-S-isoprenylcysteine O-methyltransferase Ste14
VQRSSAIIGSAVFFVLVPCVFAGLIPWWITRWRLQPAFLDLEWLRIVGVVLIAAGIPGLVDSFRRFAVEGLGTPAPIAPPTSLVVTGLYRHVRNPMYVSAISVVLGQAVLFADWRLLVYGAAFWLATHLFVLFYEEPTLTRTFGEQYRRYQANVPRWLPRLAPWQGSPASLGE